MAERRVIYLVALCGCLVFYWAYREWMSWVLLMCVVWLPWLSLVLSLWPMLKTRAYISCPREVSVGQKAAVHLVCSCPFPQPPARGRLQLTGTLAGIRQKLRSGSLLPTEHCGALHISVRRFRVYDYLGLFCLPLGKLQQAVILVRPVLVPLPEPPDMSRYLAHSFKPKHGGGFSEHHDMRLYRPGDSLRQIHWKLTAKTGKLMIREPLEAVQSRTVLTMELRGAPHILDRKLGQLLWMSRYLVGWDLPHEIHCLTGGGMVSYPVSTEADAQAAIDALLQDKAAATGQQPSYPVASWRFHIGGDADES